jgi:hypothetical protein
MKKIINKQVYDTEKAILVAEYWNTLNTSDFYYCNEELYITKRGQFFLYGCGGAASKYAETFGNTSSPSSTIILLSADEAYEWLENHDQIEAIEKYFGDKIKEA